MILEWADRCRRDLPWRRTRDPWLVLVSELMLQQTQVARVVPRYEAFVARFGRPTDCASADVGEVVRLWAGLGYNRRAVNLHRAAVMIVDEFGGTLPDDLAGLMSLPGVGPYTARAVLAFAYERDVGVVDTNAARVLSRLAGRRLGRAEVQARADAAVPPGQGWAWNQAILDLGATICTSRTPSCPACPAAVRLRLAPRRRARSRSGSRHGGHLDGSVPLRGVRSPGPRPAGRRPATRGAPRSRRAGAARRLAW